MYLVRERILIVDHDPVMAHLIATVLRRYHYRVAGTAVDGKDALSQALETEPDLALIELGMEKGIDGVNTARYFRTILNIPVIFHTLRTDTASLSRAHLAHPYAVLPIPFNDREICTAIDVALFHHDKLTGSGAPHPSQDALAWHGNGAAISDAKGIVWFLNQRGKELLGLNEGTVRRRPFDELTTFLDPIKREQIQGVIDGAMNGGPHPYLKDVCVIQKGGEEQFLGLIVHPLRNLENHLQGVISFIRPI